MQEAINRGVLAVAPCIGTDQMGPKRFGPKGKLAFSFGNVAQDEGSAMAQYAWGRGWQHGGARDRQRDRLLQEHRRGVQGALQAARRQDRRPGDVPGSAFGGNNVENAVSRLNNVKADVIVTSTAGAYGALSPLITGLRTLGNNTPILNSWAGDGNYWLPKSPQVTNYYFVTYASVFGDDPNPAINKLAKQVHAGTGGFVTGSAAIDGVVTAIKRADGSTNGAALAGADGEVQARCRRCRASSASRRSYHTVFGRQYRVIKIQDNKPHARRHGRRQGRRQDLDDVGRR